jgi:RNA polymerase subunit RPABC4/transcription elongation factor Spt4
MFPLAVFGIKNSGLNLAANLVILFLVVIWLALVYWTYADARRRIADPMLIGCATAASLFPFVGTIVYMIVRPPEYLDDVRERELEMQAAEARLAQMGYHLCPHCDSEVEKDFLRCPSCMRRLKDPCRACGRPLDPNWKVCPYCDAEVASIAAPTSRRARRRRETGSELREPVVEAREPGGDPRAERRKAREAARAVRDPAAEPRLDGLRETAADRPASEPQIT